jgi:hypothetical protein
MPSLRSVCLAWGALAAVVAGGVIGGASRRWSQLPAPAAAGPMATADAEGQGAIAPLGRTLPLRTTSGRVVDVAVLGVRLRGGSHGLIDVQLRYELRSGATYRVDPAREAQVVDGSDQLLSAVGTSDRHPALKAALLRPGRPLAGWVTFTRPTAARVVRVQVTLDAGTGPHTGQWRVGVQSP